ncbi:MAG: S-methyl-5-thioribose-1-phosphate isomerase [Anaerolineaceae bacterium]
MKMKKQEIFTLRLDDANNVLVIIDQTLLPNEIKYLRLSRVEDIWEAISELRVRGAPAIGIAASYGIYLGMKSSKANDFQTFYQEFLEIKNYLATARPTAINLFWALEKMETALKENAKKRIDALKTVLLLQSDEILQEDVRTNKAIGENVLTLLQPKSGILTHCNAGALATSKYGTATSALYLGQERGYQFSIYVDETRPLLQGARLTSFELSRAGMDVTLICDNMASTVMRNGWVQAILVGCDRVAANGDTANKIGTSGVAILAKEYGVPVYVCAPTSTIDLKTQSGSQIPIEERGSEEIYKKWYSKPMAPEEGVKFFNPAFDITDGKYITAIVTEYGIARPPYLDSLQKMMDLKIK